MSTTTAPAYIPAKWETVDCLFCGSPDYILYERFGSDLQYNYVTCKNCGLIYTNPRPAYDQHFIDAAYASYYQYADNLQLSDLNNVNESSLKMFESEVEYLVKYDTQRKAVLDIGSGMGTFLLAAKKYYTNLCGLDVSEKMAAFVEKNIGVKVHIAQFEDFNFPEKFSLIHMSHVIEHVPNPNLWLQKAKQLLDEKGILVINVPNKYSFSFRLQHLFVKMRLKRQFSDAWADPSRTPDHLFEPTARSMKYLLKKNNYEIVEYYTYSRKDPTSQKSFFSKLLNRKLKIGSNLTFITRSA